MTALTHGIGSILTANRTQFGAIYSQRVPVEDQLDYPLDAFLSDYENMQKSARTDLESLKNHGISTTPQILGAKLFEIISGAQFFHDQSDLSSREKNSILQQEKWEVLGCDFRMQALYDDCIFCDYKMHKPNIYTVRNARTKQEISFPALSAHILKIHGYFARPMSPYRLDPIQLAQVLEMS